MDKTADNTSNDDESVALPASFSTLPPEIMLAIFDFLDSCSDLFFARFICKSASPAASEVLIRRLKHDLTVEGSIDEFMGLVRRVWQVGTENEVYASCLSQGRSVGSLLRVCGLTVDSVTTMQILGELNKPGAFEADFLRGMKVTGAQLRGVMDYMLESTRSSSLAGVVNILRFVEGTGLPRQIKLEPSSAYDTRTF
jgi:hypothetical protein